MAGGCQPLFPGSGLDFDRIEAPAILLSDSNYSYRIGGNQQGINLIHTNKLGQAERLIYNPFQQLEQVAAYDKEGNLLQALDYSWNIR